MELNWKKHLLVASVACSSLLTSAYAGDGCPPPPKPKPVCDVPCDPPPAGQIGEYREITPNAGPRVCDGADVFITGTFIWWNTRQEGQAYVASGLNRDTANFPGISRGSVSHAFQSWDPGFKVGLGLNLAHDGWDIYAEYTWLRSRANSSTSRTRDNRDGLMPMWDIDRTFYGYNGSAVDVLTRASGSWRNRFNVIDLELGRNFFTSQYLSLRPFWGLKGSWQSEAYSVKYQRTNASSVVSQDRMKNNQSYWAVGLRSGLNSTWHFSDCFSLYGDLALSALWASFDIDRKDRSNENIALTSSVENTIFNSRNSYAMGKGVLEMEIGLRWETWFSNDDYHFAAQAGWEHQIWFSHNNQLHFFEESAHGDMAYMGLNISLRFDF